MREPKMGKGAPVPTLRIPKSFQTPPPLCQAQSLQQQMPRVVNTTLLVFAVGPLPWTVHKFLICGVGMFRSKIVLNALQKHKNKHASSCSAMLDTAQLAG